MLASQPGWQGAPVSSWRERARKWLEATFPAEGGEAEHEAPFRERFLRFRELDPSLRVLTGLVIAQVLVGGLVLALNAAGGFGPIIALPGGLDISIGLGAFAASGIAAVAGLTLLTQGLAAAAPSGRWFLVGALTLMYMIELFGMSFPHPGQPFVIYLFTLGVCAMAAGMPALIRRRYSPERQHPWIVRGVIGVVIVLFLALLYAIPSGYPAFLLLLHLPLIFFFFIASTDWAELVEDLTRRALHPARRLSVDGWFAIALIGCGLTALVCLTGLWGDPNPRLGEPPVPSCLVTDGPTLPCVLGMTGLLQVPIVAISLLAVYGLLRLAQFRGQWPDRLPWAALIVAIAIWGIIGDLPLDHVGVNAAGILLSRSLLVVLGIAGLLLAGRQKGLHGLAGVALFFLLVTVVASSQFMPGALPAYANFKGLCATICLGSIWGSVELYRRRSRHATAAEGLRLIAVLNIALTGIFLLGAWLYGWMRAQAESEAIAAAIIVVVALIWEVLNSGGMVTHSSGRIFPQRSRLLLFLGYVSMVVCGTLFWGSAVAPDEYQEIIHVYADTDLFVQVGIVTFAPAFLLTLFILRFGRWLESSRTAGAGSPAPAPDAAPSGPAGRTA